MRTRTLEELLDLTDEQWDAMTIEEQTLILQKLEAELEKGGFLLEYDAIFGQPPHRTVQ